MWPRRAGVAPRRSASRRGSRRHHVQDNTPPRHPDRTRARQRLGRQDVPDRVQEREAASRNPRRPGARRGRRPCERRHGRRAGVTDEALQRRRPRARRCRSEATHTIAACGPPTTRCYRRARASGARRSAVAPDGHVVLKLVPADHDPELPVGMIVIGPGTARSRRRRPVGRGENAGQFADVLSVVDPRRGRGSEVGEELVVNLGAFLEIVAVPDGLVADVPPQKLVCVPCTVTSGSSSRGPASPRRRSAAACRAPCGNAPDSGRCARPARAGRTRRPAPGRRLQALTNDVWPPKNCPVPRRERWTEARPRRRCGCSATG